jgi:hypothetical protein
MLFDSPFSTMIGIAVCVVAVTGLCAENSWNELEALDAADALASVAVSGTAGSSVPSANLSITSMEELYPHRLTMEAPPRRTIVTTAFPPPGTDHETRTPLPGALYSG